VLRWAATSERPLPWRGERDPYRVLVSEVMLQQTQAARIVHAFPVFIDRFQTASELAAADAADVLRAWGNLGYNRRALNLWRTARAIVERGGFPSSVGELEQLPGVGPYTARAVASFAFGRDVGVVEANVRRILTRLCGPDVDVPAVADGLVPRGRAAEWNQALMDLGAEVCRPRAPLCDRCPLRTRCTWTTGRFARVLMTPAAPPFATTSRYARGRVVSELRNARAWATMPGLGRRTALSASRLSRAIRDLERDGLVFRRGTRVYLGPGTSAARADPRRR
jgi:A/G-specific adenine glycosylase